MKSRHVFLFLLAIAPLTARPGHDTPEDFHAWVGEKYAFSPHELNSAQLDEKSRLLDQVWKTVAADKARLLPKLREELARTGQPRFFYYDGSKLLLSLSKASADQALAATAMARCDIRDVQREDYFHTLRSLGLSGCDVIDAALNIVDDEQFQVFVPQHVLTLGADYCLIFLLNSAEPKQAVAKLIARFESDPRESARIAVVTALWYTLEPAALAYIDALPQVDAMPKELRERIVEFRQRSALRGKGSRGFTSEASLRTKRRETLRRVSDEALLEYDELTRSIVGKMKP